MLLMHGNSMTAVTYHAVREPIKTICLLKMHRHNVRDWIEITQQFNINNSTPKLTVIFTLIGFNIIIWNSLPPKTRGLNFALYK